MAKAIIVTGASRGIGLAITQFLLKQEHNLVIVARSEKELREIEKEYPGQVAVLAGDLADLSLARQAVELAWQRWQRLDGLVVNHGVLDPVKRVGDGAIEEWKLAYDINFFSALALVEAALPLLRISQGNILFTSSGASNNAYPTWGAYGSAKAALNHLAMTLANEEKEITSLAIRPGVVDTQMQQDIRDRHNKTMHPDDAARFTELKRTGSLLTPEQPGHVIAKLVLNAPKCLSGKYLSWNAVELEDFQE